MLAATLAIDEFLNYRILDFYLDYFNTTLLSAVDTLTTNSVDGSVLHLVSSNAILMRRFYTAGLSGMCHSCTNAQTRKAAAIKVKKEIK